MKYLSYQLVNGVPTATPSDVIDDHSRFFSDGNIYSLKGINIGFNVMVFGAVVDDLINFQKLPMFTKDWDASAPGDFGKVVTQPDGKSVAIQWPL